MGLLAGACVENTKWVCLQAVVWAIQDGSACLRLCGQYKMGLFTGAWLVWAIQNGSAAKWVILPVLVGVAVTRRSVAARRRVPDHLCALLGSARPSLQLTEA